MGETIIMKTSLVIVDHGANLSIVHESEDGLYFHEVDGVMQIIPLLAVCILGRTYYSMGELWEVNFYKAYWKAMEVYCDNYCYCVYINGNYRG